MSVPTLIGAPYDAHSSFRRGPAKAPPLIRAAVDSPAGNAWSENLTDLSAPARLHDAGDLDLGDEDQAIERIEAGVAAVVGSGGRPIVLGGDHAITYPAVRALRRVHPRLSILHLDAHPDLYDAFDGDRYSHASSFARIMEEGLADQLVQVGIRAMTGHQADQAARFGVEVIDMRAWMAGRRFELRHATYLSIDLDVIDPAFAPGVSHPEPGGLTVRDVLGIVQGCSTPLVGADIVECNPQRDVAGATSLVAAKLVKEVASRMLELG